MAHLKQEVYRNNRKFEIYDQLTQRIRFVLKTFSPDYFKTLTKNLKTKIRRASDNGYDYMFR